jgi:hypothetical protein
MGVVAAVVILAIVAFFVAARFSGSNDPFQAAAAGLGLKLTRSVPDLLPRLEGIVNGLPIRVDVPEKRPTTVRYRVFYPPLGMALRLEGETTITRTMGDLGQEDTQVGGAAFDNTFKVNTSRPDALRKMMTPELRRTLVALIKEFPRILIEDGGITYVSDNTEPTQEQIIRTTASMAAAAHQLVANRPPPLKTPPPRAPQPATAETPDETARPRTNAASTPPARPAETTGKQRPARQAEAAGKPRPAPPAEPPLAEPPPTPPPPVAAPPSTGLPDGFFDEAFGANRLSFESDGRFEEKLRGTKVRLSGTVKQAREVKDDNTVTVDPSTKATVTVAQIDNDLYGKTDIDAIVFLPKGTADKLARGSSISFTGTLETVDPFMRNLFVTDARLQG